MTAVTTIIITPRDRYSGLDECVDSVYRHTPQPFQLWIMDLDYPASVIDPVRKQLAGRAEVRFFELGLRTPMDALREAQPLVDTATVVLLDNDSRVTAGWLQPLLDAHADGHAVVTPLILEREGVDRGAPLRNHLYTGELRVVDVGETPYLIEHKHFRRTEVPDIPDERSLTGTFELHCVLFDGDAFRRIELPSMVIREHLDISLQLAAMGKTMVVEPKSVIHFDNLGTRMVLSDMRFFFYRWGPKLTGPSSRLFERRWGYNFYSEQSMYNWVVRRKAFLVSRWLGAPIGIANRATQLAKKLFCRDWDPLPDPDGASRPLLTDGVPRQLSHDLR
ncbi:glycosyltransferase [Luteimonas marina]|uniref:Glycosyltransferase n=1 Tax=Luteimonas marina TaxID=488485 RepID=A0A5C5TSM8_9GAMM|nr:glycosyltransferase [Luteimonas marina]TWT17253.1 glycosyltransferase [Luteimonas marina]